VSVSNDAEHSVDVTSATIKPMTRLIYGVNNNGVEVSITKGNDQQFSNGVPAPVNGAIVDMGSNDMNGNYIVIRANSSSPFHKKGDLIRISNLANLRDDLEIGDVLDKAEQIGISGDDSDTNSTIGSSTTGQIVSPGGITVQIFQNQTGELTQPDSNAQYSQPYNTAFVNAMFSDIYSGTQAAAIEEPVSIINPDIDVGGPNLLPLTTPKELGSKWRKPDGTWNLTHGPKTLNKLRQIAELEAISTMRSQLTLDPNAGTYQTLGGLNNLIFLSRLSRDQRSDYFSLRNQFLGELRAVEEARHKK
jgi:hypothetical protein